MDISKPCPSRSPETHAVLARPRLFKNLSGHSSITLVRAPLEFEARTVLTSWLDDDHASGLTVPVWVPAPTPHATPNHYWQSVLDALYDAGLALRPFSSGGDVDALHTLTRLVAKLQTRCVLILDFFDAPLAPASTVLEAISQLASVNRNVTIMLMAPPTTSAGPDTLTEIAGTHIGPEELLFTLTETTQLCREAGVPSPETMGARIQEACAGIPHWVMRVIDLSRDSHTALIDVHGRPHPELTDAIEADLVHKLDDPPVATRRAHILALARALTMTVELVAELIADVSLAAEVLDTAQQAGLLVPADSDSDVQTWRFPRLIRHALLQCVRKQSPGRVESVVTYLARRALADNNAAAAALYASDAFNWPLALDIVEEHWVAMVTHHLAQLRGLLDAVPDHFLEDRPSAKAGKAVFVGMLAHAPALEPGLPDNDTDLRALASSPSVATTLHVATVQIIGLRIAGRYDQAMTLTRRVVTLATAAVERQPQVVHAQLPILRLQWALTFQLGGADTESVTEFMQAYRSAVADNIDFVARNSAGNLALLWAIAGHQPRTQTWLSREADFGDGGALLAPMVRVGGSVASALHHLDRLDTTAAKAVLDELGEPSHREELWAYVAYAHAQHDLLVGATYIGQAALRRHAAERAVQCSDSSFARVLITAAQAELHLALGQGNVAAAIIADTTLDHPILNLVAARVLLLTGYPERAVATVTRSLTSTDGSPRMHIEALLILAVAHRSMESPDSAVEYWRSACVLADESGCYRPFTTVSADLRRTLADASGISPSLNIDTSVFPETVHWVQLTTRERLVLDCLSRGLTPQQIASEVHVSLNTVKTQARTLYRKLGAHSRAEALTIAHALRLLDAPAHTYDD